MSFSVGFERHVNHFMQRKFLNFDGSLDFIVCMYGTFMSQHCWRSCIYFQPIWEYFCPNLPALPGICSHFWIFEWYWLASVSRRWFIYYHLEYEIVCYAERIIYALISCHKAVLKKLFVSKLLCCHKPNAECGFFPLFFF